MSLQDEENLASATGMNRFAAYLILCQITLGEFLDLDPQGRLDRFGAIIGVDRMVCLIISS